MENSGINRLPNGTHHGAAVNGFAPVKREDILELRRQRDLVEQQIQALGDILNAVSEIKILFLQIEFAIL